MMVSVLPDGRCQPNSDSRNEVSIGDAPFAGRRLSGGAAGTSEYGRLIGVAAITRGWRQHMRQCIRMQGRDYRCAMGEYCALID